MSASQLEALAILLLVYYSLSSIHMVNDHINLCLYDTYTGWNGTIDTGI